MTGLTFWGVDVATTKLAIASIPQPATIFRAWVKPAGGPRLRELRWQALAMASQLKKDTATRPTLVMVENPVLAGRGGGQGLLHATGVVIEALSESLGCPIVDRDIQTWRRILGVANNKAAVLALVAALHPDLNVTEDETEAVALAYAAALTFEASR